jgi:hypothetical protein
MQSEKPTEPNEPRPAPKTPTESKPAEKEREEPNPPPKPKQDQDIHRVFWERTRRSRAIEMLLVQAFLWINLFAFGRGDFTGLRTIIPSFISAVLLTYLLISVTKFGSIFDIAITLFYGFSSLLAVFSTLYWNYGTANNFTERLTQLDAIYFSVGTLSTAGTGNISAVSQVARGLQTLQMILDISFVVFAVSLAIAGISLRMQKKQDQYSS